MAKAKYVLEVLKFITEKEGGKIKHWLYEGKI